MEITRNQKIWQSAGCLLCIGLTWMRLDFLGASEFKGGGLTGPLFTMANAGTYIFLGAMLITLRYPRAAAAVGIIASLITLPIYFFFVAPGVFRQVFGGEYKVPTTLFTWNAWALAGLTAIGCSIYIFSRTLFVDWPNSYCES